MDFKNVLVRVIVLVISCALINGRSLRSKVAKRQANPWDAMCPPMDFYSQFNHHKRCADTCVTDDYCTGGQICCLTLNGCRKCMEPVPPPPVVDWPSGGNRGYTDRFTEGEDKNIIFLKEPHYEEVECFMDGRSYREGVFYKGCRKCVCNEGGYVTCDVYCKGDKKTRPTDEEESGSGDEETSGEQPEKKEYPNEINALNSGGDNIVDKAAGPRQRLRESKQQKQKHVKLLTEGLNEQGDMKLPGPFDFTGDNSPKKDSDINQDKIRRIGNDFIERLKQEQSHNSHKISAHDVVDVEDMSSLGDVFLA